MKLNRKLALALVGTMLSSAACAAQSQKIPETRNAALRYWIAFADLQDLPADKETQDFLAKTAAGEVPWDEAKLGPIVQQNEAAILGMQRATKLPDCDWGLEYQEGERMSIAPAVKGRVMARLNTLYGIRLASKGETQAAVDSWRAGVRLSQDMTKGGSLIFVLIAKEGLTSVLSAAQRAADSGKLSPSQQKQLADKISALPETVFDWSSAIQYEEISLESFAVESRRDPATWYQKLMDRPAPAGFTAPTDSEIAQYRKFIASTQISFGKPPEQTAKDLKKLEDILATQHLWFREGTPSLQRINDARRELELRRQAALKALSAEPSGSQKN